MHSLIYFTQEDSVSILFEDYDIHESIAYRMEVWDSYKIISWINVQIIYLLKYLLLLILKYYHLRM